MAISAAAFYFFSAIAVLAALLVVTARNPVHSVLWLILTFFTASGLFVLLGAEFLAMILLIVYVGAVAVLFLFVVMMLDVDFAELRGGLVKYAPLGLLIGLVLVIQLIIGVSAYVVGEPLAIREVTPDPAEVENTRALGRVLYTRYVLLFQTAGVILFVAMVGAIVLTLRQREGIKRQNVLAQMYRDPAEAMDVRDVKPGQGL